MIFPNTKGLCLIPIKNNNWYLFQLTVLLENTLPKLCMIIWCLLTKDPVIMNTIADSPLLWLKNLHENMEDSSKHLVSVVLYHLPSWHHINLCLFTLHSGTFKYIESMNLDYVNDLNVVLSGCYPTHSWFTPESHSFNTPTILYNFHWKTFSNNSCQCFWRHKQEQIHKHQQSFTWKKIHFHTYRK